MSDTRQRRRLAAVLVADIVGYSRMMEADESGTLDALKALRQTVLAPAVAAFGGHLVKTTGDGMLVEFPSALDAVSCALRFQTQLSIDGASARPDDGMRLRVGIHLGDIILDEDDIFGDGVNIAARLEAIAPPGGIAVSGSIHEQVAGKLDARFADGGERQMKNISRPQHVWTWRPDADGGKDPAPASDGAGRGRPPVVAVLRFTTAGEDPDLDGLADGLADDLTTAFSSRRGIEIVGRAAARPFDAGPRDVDSVRTATGADYVLTGGLRRSGGRLRVTAELIETTSGGQLWTNRYDRDWGDVFVLGDDLTERIAISARTAMNAFDGRRYGDRPEETLTNAERRARAAQYFYRFTADGFEKAGRLLDAVLADDPDDAMALSMRAFALAYANNFGLGKMDHTERQRALDMAARAVHLDRTSDYGYQIRGLLALHLRGDCDGALADAERSLALSPQYGLAMQLKAEALCYGGRQDEGIPLMRKLIDVDPRDPVNFFRHWVVAMGQFAADDAAAALRSVAAAHEGAMANPVFDLSHAAILARLGEKDRAAEIVRTLLARWPGATLETVRLPPFKPPAVRRRFREALASAGMPTATG